MTVGGMRHYSTYVRWLPVTSSTRARPPVVGRGAELFESAIAARIGLGVRTLLDGQRATCEERTGGESQSVR